MEYKRKIVRIGNSYGIVLPKVIMKLSNIEHNHMVNLTVKKNKLVITPQNKK